MSDYWELGEYHPGLAPALVFSQTSATGHSLSEIRQLGARTSGYRWAIRHLRCHIVPQCSGSPRREDGQTNLPRRVWTLLGHMFGCSKLEKILGSVVSPQPVR